MIDNCCKILSNFIVSLRLYHSPCNGQEDMCLISNSNWAEWSNIQGVIAQVISKSVKHEAQGQFDRIYSITNFGIKNVFWKVHLREKTSNKQKQGPQTSM